MKYLTKDFHNETPKDVIKTGVYTIEFINKPDIYYVGSASKHNKKGRNNNGFHGRWREHLHMLFNNKHYNKKLQNNFNKYGKNNLLFSIIDFYEPEFCIGAEQYWLNMLNSYNNGYNLSYVVEKSSLGRKLTNEQKKIISERMMGDKNPNYRKIYTQEERNSIGVILSKSILQYDFNINLIKEWNSIIEATETLSIDGGNISKCCNYEQLTYKKYFWFFSDTKINIKEHINNILIRKKEAQKHRNQKRREKMVVQYDLKGNMIKIWNSLKEATLSINGTNGNISNCCNGKSKTYKGFIWKYE
jgi:group I intron endonuclease